MAKYIINIDNENAIVDGHLSIPLDLSIRGSEEETVELNLIVGNNLTPYEEPDIDAVRKEAYEQGYTDGCKKHEVEIHAIAYAKGNQDGYQKGLSDAWEAARKIWKNNMNTLHKIFGWVPMRIDIFLNYTASEAIEKIRQYEQEKEEQIQVWDEVKVFERKPFIVTGFGYGDDDVVYCHGFVTENGISISAKKDECVKTGRSFPEIAEVMQEHM